MSLSHEEEQRVSSNDMQLGIGFPATIPGVGGKQMTFNPHPSLSIGEEKRSITNWQACSASGLASPRARKLAPLAPPLRKLAGRKSSSELSRHTRFTVSDTGETASLLAGEDFRWRTRVSGQLKTCGMLLGERGNRAWLETIDDYQR
jgi:hypothetical protein